MRIMRVPNGPSAATLVLIVLIGLFLSNVPNVRADTFGNISTSGMSAYPAAGVSGTVNGNVGIYADSGGSPGALMTQGTSKAISNGQNDFTSLSASVTIVSSTNYWLAFEMAGGSFYWTTSGTRGYASASCCTLPSTISGVVTTSSYAVFATYATGPDFSISATPTSQSVGAGSTACYTLNLASLGGYTRTAYVSLAGVSSYNLTIEVS